MSLTQKMMERIPKMEDITDWLYEHNYFPRFAEGFRRQVAADRKLASRLKEAGLEKPLKYKSLSKYPSGFNAAQKLQRFEVATPTDTYRAEGNNPYYVIHDLGTKVAYMIPFSIYMK